MSPDPSADTSLPALVTPLDDADVVAVVGDNCIDLYPATETTTIGGNAPNVAVRLREHGVRSEFVGRVGGDDLGRRIAAGLRARDVLVRPRVTSSPTCVGVLETDARGLTHIAATRGDCSPYRLTEDDLAHLATRRHVHLKEVADIAWVVERLAASGTSHSYDYSDYAETAGELDRRAAQVSFFSCGAGPDGLERGRKVIARAFELGAEVAIATLGADGSIGRFGDLEVRVDVEPVEQVDSIGAGDAFIAAALAALLRGEGLESAMRRGAAAGAAACGHVAAWPQAFASQHDVAGGALTLPEVNQ